MAHSLLRHLRNAAHGKITNENRKKIYCQIITRIKGKQCEARPLTSYCLILFRCYTNLSIKLFPFSKKWYLLGKTSLLWINKQY